MGKAIAQGTAAPGHRAQGEGKAVPACCLCSALPPSQVDPYLPYEYTCEGMLERIHAYIQHQVGEHPCSPWGSIPVLLATHVLPGEPSLLSHLPLGKQLLTQCSSPARDPRSQPCAASGLIAEGTRRWGLGESCHEPKMLGGLWKVGGCWGWVKAFLLQRIRQHWEKKRWPMPSPPTAGDAIYACR